MFDQLCAAQDTFNEIRRKYGQGLATYEEMYAAAVALLALRVAAETKRYGKPKTKITSVAIASLLR
jgi:hypothetical protein